MNQVNEEQNPSGVGVESALRGADASRELSDWMLDAALCYIDGNKAFFTTNDLTKQWGDDWDDAPYEHNAGDPYLPYKPDEYWQICSVYFDVDLETPEQIANGNSRYSVRIINAGAVAWLGGGWSKLNVSIAAGTTLRNFIQTIQAVGGTVYAPIQPSSAVSGDHGDEVESSLSSLT